MSARILSAGLALAAAFAACLPDSALAAEDNGNGGGSPSNANPQSGANVRRNRPRIGNFKGGHLGASSFGDGTLPGQNSVDANAPPPGAGVQGNVPPGAGAGFLGQNGAGPLGGNGPPPQGSGADNSFSRATMGTRSRDDGDNPRPFPTRFGNTELRQWETGANVPWDPSYAYWANWGVNAGLLMEFGWGFPMMGMGMMGMGMGMPGMMSPYANGGYGQSPGNPYPGAAGAYGTGDYNPYGSGGATSDSSTNSSPAERNTSVSPPDPPVPMPDGPAPQPESTLKSGSADAKNAKVHSDKGEVAFRSGDYKRAAYHWKHALVDDPENGVLAMLYAQALLAVGQYRDAASATQAAMRLLPEDQWDVVVANRRELYAEPRVYLDQLLAVDKAAKTSPTDPGLRFLSGFHYACLGYPKAALDNLEKGLKLAPQDELAQKLRDRMRSKLPASNVPPMPQPPPDGQTPAPASTKST
jgi:tetratricopeptide (TPR) repeat protein